MPQRQDEISKKVKKKIKKYGLEKVSRVFYANYPDGYERIKRHSERIALKAERVAKRIGQDKKLTFISGLLHDIGKFQLPADIFDDHPIDEKEFQIIKTHPQLGYEKIKEIDLFVAGCVGLHHAVYNNGYGINTKEIAKKITPQDLRKMLEISTIISIIDFIDAYTHRKDGRKNKFKNTTLKEVLRNQYPYDKNLIQVCLKVSKGK